MTSHMTIFWSVGLLVCQKSKFLTNLHGAVRNSEILTETSKVMAHYTPEVLHQKFSHEELCIHTSNFLQTQANTHAQLADLQKQLQELQTKSDPAFFSRDDPEYQKIRSADSIRIAGQGFNNTSLQKAELQLEKRKQKFLVAQIEFEAAKEVFLCIYLIHNHLLTIVIQKLRQSAMRVSSIEEILVLLKQKVQEKEDIKSQALVIDAVLLQAKEQKRLLKGIPSSHFL